MRRRHQRTPRLVSLPMAAGMLGISTAELNRRLDAGLPHLEAYGHRWLDADTVAVLMEAQ